MLFYGFFDTGSRIIKENQPGKEDLMQQKTSPRRRKKKRKTGEILRNIAITAVILVVTATVLKTGSCPERSGFSTYVQQAEIHWNKAPLRELERESADCLRELADSDRAVRQILESAEDYPLSLLELLAKNPEATGFVEAYPTHKEDTPADTVGRIAAGEIPLLLQWDDQWGYTTYGSDFLAITGCGPTCLSMVAAGLTGDDTVTPHRVAEYAENNGYYVDGAGSTWSLMTEGCRNFGLWSRELPLDESVMRSELEAGAPIVCSMLPGDFTENGHFIVIVGAEPEGFRVNDPNSPARSGKIWSYETLAPQIGNLWAFYPA